MENITYSELDISRTAFLQVMEFFLPLRQFCILASVPRHCFVFKYIYILLILLMLAMQNKPVRWNTALKKWPLVGFIGLIYFFKSQNLKMLKHHSEGLLYIQVDILFLPHSAVL